MTHAIAIFAALLWTLANTVHAQSRTCRIVYPDRPQGMQKVAYLFDGSKSREVSLPSMNFSEVIPLTDGGITITLTTDRIENPELLPAKAPKLIIPEHVRNFYIIITTDPANEYLPIKIDLADVEEHKIGLGETLWCNYTAHRIVAKLGISDLSVAPGERTVSKAPADASGYYEAEFTYQVRGEDPLLKISEQNWWHDSKSRSLGFIIDSGRTLPKILTFRDYRQTIDFATDGEIEQNVVEK